jgi:nucleotide-binding universal stress UspA family protein
LRRRAAGPISEQWTQCVREVEMRILLAVDGSAPSEVAVSTVAGQSWPAGTVVRVIAVAPPFIPPVGVLDAGVSAEAIPLMLDEARLWASQAQAQLEAAGLQTQRSIRSGGAGPQIVEEAREWMADLVVVGSHGRTGLRRLFMGSVAEHVVRHAPCSVEVARVPAWVASSLSHPG